MKYFFIFLFSVLPLVSFSQITSVEIFNQVDSLGRKQGKWIELYKGKQIIKVSEQFKDGLRNGWTIYFDKKGNKKVEYYFSNNRLVISKSYFTRGKKKGRAHKIHGLKINRNISLHSFKTDSSTLNSSEFNIFDSTYRKQGLWYEVALMTLFSSIADEYYSCGTYINNKKNGRWRFYYFEGRQLVYECDYINDSLNGKVIYYDLYGRVKSITEYKDNLKNGKAISFFDNGQVSVESNFLNGNFVGEFIKYDKKGKQTRYIKDTTKEHPFWQDNRVKKYK